MQKLALHKSHISVFVFCMCASVRCILCLPILSCLALPGFFFSTPFYTQSEVFVCSVLLFLDLNTTVCSSAADAFRTIPVLTSKPKSAPLVSVDILNY